MEHKSEQLKEKLDKLPKLQKHLFEKGFLITNAEMPDLSAYPFYGNWNVTDIQGYKFVIYKNVPFYNVSVENRTIFLIGHAYNPYSMQIDEIEILKDVSQDCTTINQNVINQLTGIFIVGVITDNGIEFQLDASGMQYACYGKIQEKLYISSHMRLIADICNLQTSDYVRRLISYRWYHYMLGNYLPGDLTCCDEMKRVIPNTSVSYNGNSFNINRFYPSNRISMCETEDEYNSVIAEGVMVMHNTMECIAKKWSNPAISLTGGIDSNTTFAAANGLYHKFNSFSYVSMYRESVDADAAKKIAAAFDVPHKTYEIPDSNDAFENFDVYKAIFEHNDGDIGGAKDDDTRKKIYLINNDICDVEVKSWVSETIRAYAYKYFGRTVFPKSLKPRDYTSLFKIFLGKRKLCRETDRYFANYLKDTSLKEHLFNYDETDFFIWEMEHGGKCGLDIGVMKSCFDITIPYNNRNLLDLLLRVPLDKRISDRHHIDMKKTLNKKLFDMNVRVVNLNETAKRKKAINLYYMINTHLPY